MMKEWKLWNYLWMKKSKNRLVVSKLSPTWRLENKCSFSGQSLCTACTPSWHFAFRLDVFRMLRFQEDIIFSTEQSLSSWVIMSRKYLQLWVFSHSISVSAQFEECTPHFDLWKRSVSYGNSCELHYVPEKALGLL